MYQKSKFLSLLLAVFSFFIVFVGEQFYRPWVKTNNFSDFGLVDFFPSFFGTLVVIFLFGCFSKQQDFLKIVTGGTVGCLIYELLQPALNTGIFDWKDLMAIIIAGSLSWLLVKKWVVPRSDLTLK